MNSDKLTKQIRVVIILLFVCVVINFVISFMGMGSGGSTKLDKELSDAYERIGMLEREVTLLTENINTGEGGGKSIAYELLEGRVAILERSGVGSDASVDQRLKNLEMMVSSLEIAFKQKAGVNSTASTNTKPPATTTTTSSNRPQQQQTTASSGGGNKTPIQIQTGSSSTAPANAKYHTVQAGENLFRISQKYGLTVEQLRRLNNMKENDVLKAGQRLIVSQ